MASSSTKVFPTFFKVIMGDTSDTSLIIPPEFIRRFGNYLSNPVFLKLPNGKKLTEVELNQANGRTLMSRGWPEFKRRLSLGFGHFLLFEYNWNSQFNVRIFDTSAVEITYPFESKTDFLSSRKRKVCVENREDARSPPNDAVEISDKYDYNLSSGPEEIENNHSQHLVENREEARLLLPNDVIVISDDEYPVKKSLRTTGNRSSGNKKCPKTESWYPNTHSQHSVDCRVKNKPLFLNTRSKGPVDCRVKPHESTGDCSVTGTGRRYPEAIQKETSIAYQQAIAFAFRLNPQNTPFFILLMQKSYISCRYSLKLPLSFAGPSFSRAEANSITMVTDGGKWSVRGRVNGTYVYLSLGWWGFVKDKELKVGDVCIFQVANKSNKQQQPVWNVIIFRA